MPVTITPTDTYPANFTEAQDGESVSQATRVNVIQEYADAINHLRNRVVASVGGDVTVPLLSYKVFPAPAATEGDEFKINDDSNTTIANFGLLQYVVNGAGLPTEQLWWELPNMWTGNVQITGVAAVVNGSGGPAGSHGALPQHMPRIRLLRIDAEAGDLAVVGTATDGSSGVATYELAHTIALTGLTQTFSAAKAYFLELRGEGGTNSLADALLLTQVRMTLAAF